MLSAHGAITIPYVTRFAPKSETKKLSDVDESELYSSRENVH